MKRDIVVDVTDISDWHCTLFLEDTKFLFVSKSLFCLGFLGTAHLHDCITLSTSLLEIYRSARFVTSLQNNSRVMCQNKVKMAKNYQRPLHL